MINESTLNFIRFSSGFNNLKAEELEMFVENEIFELNEYNASEETQRILLQNTDGTQGVVQEDGKYNHTAWAYSADGTDRFTTIYPNLNLFTGTSNKPYTKTGTNWNNSVIGVYNTPKVGQEYTVSVEVTEADHDVLFEVWRCNDVKDRVDLITSKRANAGEKIHLTFTWPDPGNSGATQILADFVWTNGTDIGSYSYRKVKLEPGSTATPWMPSASEVTTADYPSYIGQYTDYTLEDSTDPSSYTWKKAQGKYFYTLEDVNTNGTLKSYIIECLKLSLQTRWGNNLEYHIDRKTKYLNKLTGMQL